MAKQTPLHSAHVALAAKLVDFAGWDMPIHYGSQVDEHHQVRRDSGMFDVSHMLNVDVEGAAARPFLHRLLANNVDRLKEAGKALYSCMLNPAGGVIDDLIVYYFAEDRFRVVVNAGTADKDVAWMQARAAQFDASLAITPRRDLAMIAVQGPQARAKVWTALPGSAAATSALKPFQAAPFGELLIARTGYTGEDGFEIMLPESRADALWQDLLHAAVKPAGLGARDTLRLEAGMNLYGQDMDESVSPLESGLAWTVDLAAPRDFIGKAALQALTPTRQLVGLLLEDRGVLRAHQKVATLLGDGETTSGSFAPSLGRSIAFARIPVGISPGDPVQVEVRGKLLAARVMKLPFVRNGQVLI